MKEYKYLGIVQCKYGEMEEEIKTVKGRCVIGSFARYMIGISLCFV